MENLPIYISILFVLILILGLLIFSRATHYNRNFLILLTLWMIIQAALTQAGFYKVDNTLPPRFIFLLMPVLILIITLFLTKRGRAFIDSLDIRILTLFSVIRIPVEIVLYLLAIHKAIPELMTFEGRNFDILSGISAPLIYYLVFKSRRLSKRLLLVWNFVCLALLLNIVVIAILSIPGTMQQMAFEQPNRAVTQFPFIFLPCCLVPMVLFSHLVSIRKIMLNRMDL